MSDRYFDLIYIMIGFIGLGMSSSIALSMILRTIKNAKDEQ